MQRRECLGIDDIGISSVRYRLISPEANRYLMVKSFVPAALGSV